MTTTKHTEVSKPGTDGLSSFEAFQKWEEASRDTIDVKRCYIDLAGDLVTGILLSQIIFWFLPSKGKSRLRIERDSKHWLAKSRSDWWDECRITEKQFDRSIKILRNKRLVETRLWRFAGSPTLHVCLNGPSLVEGVKSILTKGQNRYLPKVKIDIDQKVKTKDIDYGHRLLTETTIGEEEEDNPYPPPGADIITFFQEEMKINRINPAMERELGDLVENFPPDRVKGAISAAALHEVGSPLPYIRTVLENERDGKEKEKKPTEGKFAFEHAPNVFLTESEVLDLVERFGSPSAEARIEEVSLYKGSTGKVYESDYQAILLWDRRGNPDGTSWEPEPPDWHINLQWLESVRAKLAPQAVRQSITLAEWFKLWSEERLKDATVGMQSFYNQTFVTHILPALGDIPLRELTRSWVRRMLDTVPTNSQGFPGRSRIRGALQDCLAGAIDKGFLNTNPASRFEYVDSVCKWCGRTFRAQKRYDGGPPSDHCNRQTCVDKDREEWKRKRASAAPAPAAPETPPPVRDGNCGCFVIGGYTPTSSSRRPFRSLVLGLPASDGLKHVGNVGGGFKLNVQPELYDLLQDIRTGESPFEPGTDMKKIEKYGSVSWVRPTLIAEVKYSGEVTQAGKLYEPFFQRLRPDLKPEDASYDGGG